jgi:Zn-dependent M28 family amino/carboxypeptidase
MIGILPGSDPQLKDTCVILSAHYDHLGMKPASAAGDRIYNGANDNGSGTVSVIEIAAALSKLKIHPRRSIVLVTFFGEEEGLLGSDYYTRHPVFPLAKTVANLNLENMAHIDRTVAAATLLLADAMTTPHWNESKEAEPFRKARH